MKVLEKILKHRYILFIFLAFLLLVSAYLGRHYYRIWNQKRIDNEIRQKDIQEKKKFIQRISPEAQEMQRKYHVYSSITIAQAILESQWGTSKLSSKYFNLFGIKGTRENSKLMTTKEYVNGRWIVIKGYFRVYKDWNESIKDHTKLMITGTESNKKNYHDVINAKDYKEAAIALQKSGYATDPDYAEKLISVIKSYRLYEYDILE